MVTSGVYDSDSVPISLIVVQSHNQENKHLLGSKNYVFESLPQIIACLLDEELSASAAYYTILSFNPSITVRDFVMVYYNHMKRLNPGAHLTVRINEVLDEIQESLIAQAIGNQRVGDDLRGTQHAPGRV